MIGTLGFSQLPLSCYIGVFEEERRVLQTIEVDLRMEVDLKAAIAADNIERSVDYNQVALALQEYVQGKVFFLLETLASQCLDFLFARFPICSATITLKKQKGGERNYIPFVTLSRS